MVTTIREVERFWDRRPCNVRHSSLEVGSRDWSAAVTARKYFVEPHIPTFAQFERWRNRRVWEIGCGIGTDAIEFLNAGASYYGCDVSRESIRIARRRIELNRYRGITIPITLVHANAEEWRPYGDGTFDLVYSFGVIHHTPTPERVIEQAKAALRYGGELRMMLYARWSLKNLLREQPEAQSGCPIVRKYTARSVKKLLGDSFVVESIEKAHIFSWRVKDYVEYRYVKRWPYRLMPARVFSILESLLGWHLLVVARKI